MAFGTSPKYGAYDVPQFEFPDQILFSECQIKNERHFIEFLLRNEWVQHQVGVKMGSSNGFFPDIKGHIFNDPETPIRVEVEYRAENYISHGHSFRGCDMILSFVRCPDTRVIKGVPVVSFYEAYKNDKWGMFCLFDDFKYDPNTEIDEENMTGIEKRMFNLGGDYLKKYRERVLAKDADEDEGYQRKLKAFERLTAAHKIEKFKKDKVGGRVCIFCGFENKTKSEYCSSQCATTDIQIKMNRMKLP